MAVLVGVDVGGSGLRSRALVHGSPTPVIASEGIRITRTGIDVESLVDAVVGALRGVPAPDVLVWAMRGLAALAEPTAILDMLRTRIRARRAAVCGDALASMVGAVGGVRPGAVVASGTGAIAFATDFDTVWRRIDGWGHILGDRGSAAWVGLRALQTALETYDGVSKGGEALLSVMVERLGDPDTWPRTVMTREDAVADVAGLAPSVTALAANDEVAAEICTDAGRALARSLSSAARGIEGVCLSRTGGLLTAEPVLGAFEAEASVLGLEVAPPLGTALDGALHLARYLAEGPSVGQHPDFLLVDDG